MQDVKSVYGGPDLGNVGAAKTFNGDIIPVSYTHLTLPTNREV